MGAEQKAGELGITFPTKEKGYLNLCVRTGNLLITSGHVSDVKGKLGAGLTVEQGYQAARYTAINCLAGIKLALGDLDRVASIIRSLNFVVCTPEFYDVHRVSSGATDLFVEVFGPERGLGGRATIGVVSLAKNACFENWLTLEIR